MSRSGRLYRSFAITGIALLVVAWVFYMCGARINRTASLPKGLYWAIEKQPERGDIVTFWPDGSEPFRTARDRGYIIPGVYNTTDGVGYDLMMKRLLGLPGDVVSITDDGVLINGDLVPNTRPLACDNMGDPLPKVRFTDYRLKEDEALFLSDHLPRSFDGRYFGVQRMRQIVEVLVPVVTWQTKTQPTNRCFVLLQRKVISCSTLRKNRNSPAQLSRRLAAVPRKKAITIVVLTR